MLTRKLHIYEIAIDFALSYSNYSGVKLKLTTGRGFALLTRRRKRISIKPHLELKNFDSKIQINT